jgi:hypothetical protein
MKCFRCVATDQPGHRDQPAFWRCNACATCIPTLRHRLGESGLPPVPVISNSQRSRCRGGQDSGLYIARECRRMNSDNLQTWWDNRCMLCMPGRALKGTAGSRASPARNPFCLLRNSCRFGSLLRRATKSITQGLPRRTHLTRALTTFVATRRTMSVSVRPTGGSRPCVTKARLSVEADVRDNVGRQSYLSRRWFEAEAVQPSNEAPLLHSRSDRNKQSSHSSSFPVQRQQNRYAVG